MLPSVLKDRRPFDDFVKIDKSYNPYTDNMLCRYQAIEIPLGIGDSIKNPLPRQSKINNQIVTKIVCHGTIGRTGQLTPKRRVFASNDVLGSSYLSLWSDGVTRIEDIPLYSLMDMITDIDVNGAQRIVTQPGIKLMPAMYDLEQSFVVVNQNIAANNVSILLGFWYLPTDEKPQA